MATDLVAAAVTNLRSLYQNESDLNGFVEKEMKNLESYLSAIEGVLQDAEQKQLANTSDAVKHWLQELEDAVYVLDDILDDCATEAIRDNYEGDRSCAFLSFLHPHKIKFHHDISGRMKAIREDLDRIDKEKNQLSLSANAAVTERQAYGSRRHQIAEDRATCSAVTEDVYGRENDKEKLVSQLLEHDNGAEKLSVHPIYGMGGLGKTTLAKLVFNDERVREHFQPRIWVCVSDNFELKTLIKAIIESPESQDHLESLQNRLRDKLQGRRYLLVLDDVWNDNQEKWKQLRGLLSYGLQGSSVLVTTRKLNIAKFMRTPSIEPYQLPKLSHDDCWLLFKRYAFASSDVHETHNLIEIGMGIVRKCGGVPLAAKVLGSLLSLEADEKSWVRVKDSEMWKLTNAEDSIFGVLKLSYLNLPSRYRRCFSYCALFPKDFQIEKEEVIHLWMANSLIPSKGIVASEAEEIGDEIVKELNWRSLIENVEMDEYGDIQSFRMHDLIHDLALHVKGDEIYVSGGTDRKGLQPTARHLRVGGDVGFSTACELVENAKCLRTLIDSSRSEFSTWFISKLSKQNTLRALHLEFDRQLKSLPYSVCVLKHLRYLNLSHSVIEELPESIYTLWNLQILKLDGCYELKKLPQNIGRLGSLRHLYMRWCGRVSSIPPSLGGLTSLRTLNHVVVGKGEGDFQLSALGHFKYVKGEMEIRYLERVRELKHAREVNLMEKRYLDRLTFSWGSDLPREYYHSANMEKEMQTLEALRPSSELKCLKLKSYGGPSFPQWMMNDIASFSSIQSVYLKNCRNCPQLPPLWRLPCLKSLKLRNLDSLRYLIEIERDSDGRVMFPSLETLRIEYSGSLEGVLKPTDEVELELKDNDLHIFPRLSRLNITSCPRLSSSTFGALPSLRYLLIDDIALLPKSDSNVQNLNSLEELGISQSDSLESFPDQMFQGVSSLRSLSFCHCNKLKSLPEDIKHLSSLERLIIHCCEQLVDMPSAIHHLPSLRTLDLSHLPIVSLDILTTELAGLPKDIPRLLELRSLDLHFCENLVSLPHWLGDSKNLEYIYISGCPKLACIPKFFQRLTKLEHLSIYGCPELARRCRKETGEDWNNIAHIPKIFLDSGRQ